MTDQKWLNSQIKTQLTGTDEIAGNLDAVAEIADLVGTVCRDHDRLSLDDEGITIQ